MNDQIELFKGEESPSLAQIMASQAQTRREEDQEALRYNIVGLLISKTTGEVDSGKIIDAAKPLVDFIMGK